MRVYRQSSPRRRGEESVNDFQLRRLKERIGKVLTPISDEELLGLIARLEAAENAVKALWPHDGYGRANGEYEAWLKSKGLTEGA